MHYVHISTRAPTQIIRGYRWLVAILLVVLAGLNTWGMTVYVRENAELVRIADQNTIGAASDLEQTRKLLAFIATQVQSKRSGSYFLLPVFRILRPTALQTIQTGGDCSYKANALIALLQKKGISATKIGLHDANGEGVHAVAVVNTDRGTYVVDALFGIIFENDDNTPITLADLKREPELLGRTIDREIRNGNTLAWKYPLNKYVYSDVKSFNWRQYAVTDFIYRCLVASFGAAAIDGLPRSAILTEPALMVLVGSCAIAFVAIAPLFVGAFFKRRKRRANVGADSSEVNVLLNGPAAASRTRESR